MPVRRSPNSSLIRAAMGLGAALLAGACASTSVQGSPGPDAASPPSADALVQRAFDPRLSPSERLGAISALDSDAPGAALLRDAAASRLVTESSPQVIERVSAIALARGWNELDQSLVRNWSRSHDSSPSAVAARRALQTAHPGEQLGALVWDILKKSERQEDRPNGRWGNPARIDAWNLLARLAHQGSCRLDELAKDGDSPGPAQQALLRGREHGLTHPATGEELEWWVSVFGTAPDRPDPTARNSDAFEAIAQQTSATVPDDRSTSLRHLPTLAWAQAARPLWVDLSRDQLLQGLTQRLATRRTHDRKVGNVRVHYPESLKEVAPVLSRADLLCILVIDEALRSPGVARALIEQARLDRADRATEYGGLLLAASGSVQVEAKLYPPRPAERRGDHAFVASDEMLIGDRGALAHYHFHAQAESNDEYAGPSAGDLDYAARFQRNCIVLTSLSGNRLAIDYYQPAGVVVDLGELEIPR